MLRIFLVLLPEGILTGRTHIQGRGGQYAVSVEQAQDFINQLHTWDEGTRVLAMLEFESPFAEAMSTLAEMGGHVLFSEIATRFYKLGKKHAELNPDK